MSHQVKEPCGATRAPPATACVHIDVLQMPFECSAHALLHCYCRGGRPTQLRRRACDNVSSRQPPKTCRVCPSGSSLAASACQHRAGITWMIAAHSFYFAAAEQVRYWSCRLSLQADVHQLVIGFAAGSDALSPVAASHYQQSLDHPHLPRRAEP